MRPETQYARSGDLHIAYQVFGEGPALVWIPGWISHVEHWWDHPRPAGFLRRLASFSRVIIFDKRGTGMSDRHAGVPNLDERLDDLIAVLDAAESERSTVLGISFEGGAIGCLAAATHPDRIERLVLYGATPRFLQAPDFPWGLPAESFEALAELFEVSWSDGEYVLQMLARGHEGDERFKEWLGRWGRMSAGPGSAAQLFRTVGGIDVRAALPSIHVPALVMHRSEDRTVSPECGRYLARAIPGARFVELDGVDHAIFAGDPDPVLSEIRGFVTGVHAPPARDRALATVLFTDIVGSTEQAASLGDERWRRLLEEHDIVVRSELARHRGREVKSTGDGVLAVFDAPIRAVRCALAVCESVRRLGIEVRAGLHTGECELIGGDVGGLAVHIAARVAAAAGPGEVLVSDAVAGLTVGSGLVMTDRDVRALKGVPGEWQLYAAASD